MKLSRSSTSLAIGIALAAGTSTSNACTPGGYIGSMTVFAGNFAIRGCALAQGQLLQINDNTALFAILGTTYGGDGRQTFGLPDTRGRSIIGVGTGDGLTEVRQGEEGGQESHTLTANQMPSHNHAVVTTVEAFATAHASTANADTADPTGSVWAVAKKGKPQVYKSAAPDVTMQAGAVSVSATATSEVGNSGDSQAFSLRSPYIGMHWLIQMTGVFPSRN